MNTLKYLALAGMLTMLLPAASMASARQQKKNIAIADQVQVAGKTLQPGTYQVEWQNNGPKTQVNFMRFGKTVVTAPATVAQLQQKAPYDAVVENTRKNGTKVISEIEWNNQRQALKFGPQAATTHHSHKRAS